MDLALGCPLAGHAGAFPAMPELPPALPGMGALGHAAAHAGGLGPGFAKSRQARFGRVLHRRDLCGGKKGGADVGKTKRGNGTKLMAVADGAGVPVAVYTASASPHEATLVEGTLEQRFIEDTPERLIGDLAYDSDKLDAQLAKQDIETIAPHRQNRTQPVTQDGRRLGRNRKRWRVEQLFAWL